MSHRFRCSVSRVQRSKWYVVSALVVAFLVFLAVFWGFPGSAAVVYPGIAAAGGNHGRAWPLIAAVSFVVDTAIVWLAIWLTLHRTGRRG